MSARVKGERGQKARVSESLAVLASQLHFLFCLGWRSLPPLLFDMSAGLEGELLDVSCDPKHMTGMVECMGKMLRWRMNHMDGRELTGSRIAVANPDPAAGRVARRLGVFQRQAHLYDCAQPGTARRLEGWTPAL